MTQLEIINAISVLSNTLNTLNRIGDIDNAKKIIDKIMELVNRL